MKWRKTKLLIGGKEFRGIIEIPGENWGQKNIEGGALSGQRNVLAKINSCRHLEETQGKSREFMSDIKGDGLR